MKFRCFGLAALTAAAIGALAAGPAGAASPLVAGGSFVRTVPFIDGSIYAFECHAAAPGAVSTTVSSCTMVTSAGVNEAGAPAVTSSGSVAQTHDAVSMSVFTYHLCWTASAKFSDGSTQTASGCT